MIFNVYLTIHMAVFMGWERLGNVSVSMRIFASKNSGQLSTNNRMIHCVGLQFVRDYIMPAEKSSERDVMYDSR